MGDFRVRLLTPPLKYWLETEAERAAAKSRDKRNSKHDAVKGTYQPFEDFYNWREYVGEYKPILHIRATPELGESFLGALGRGMAANYGIIVPATLRFKTDFYKMRLLCGDKVVAPIHPAKIAHLLNSNTLFVSVNDATYEGFYSNPADAITSSCGKVTLEVYSEKNPMKPQVKVLDPKTVALIEKDFAPYPSGKSTGQ